MSDVVKLEPMADGGARLTLLCEDCGAWIAVTIAGVGALALQMARSALLSVQRSRLRVTCGRCAPDAAGRTLQRR